MALRLAALFVVAVHFLWFGWRSLGSHFAPDEMMNLYGSWEAGLGKTLWRSLACYEPSYRPTGGLYYLGLYRLFHLCPEPFRVFDLLLLALNLWLTYRLIRALDGSRPVAWFAVFLMSYHEPVMIWLMYNGAWTYDRLCFTFTVALWLVYLRLRNEGGWIRYLAVVTLFLLALGAKEMAVAIPVLLLAHEVIHYRPRKPIAALILVLAVLAALHAWGKTHGPEALVLNPQYRLKAITAGNYLDAQARHMQDYFFLAEPWSAATAAALLTGMAAAAGLARSRLLAFAVAWIVIAPLPIAFINRAGGALYLPMLGWCIFVAAAIEELSRRLPPRARTCAMAALMLVVAGLRTRENLRYSRDEQAAMLHNGDVTTRMIEDLNRLRPEIRPGAKIFVEKNPFSDWDMLFIVAVWADVQPIDVVLIGKNVPPDGMVPGVTGVLSLDATGHLTYRKTKPGEVINTAATP